MRDSYRTSAEIAAGRRFDRLCTATSIVGWTIWAGVALFGAGLLGWTPTPRLAATVGLVVVVVCGVGARLLEAATDRAGESLSELLS